MRRVVPFLALMVALAGLLMLAGCGGGDEPAETTAVATDTTAQTTPSVTEQTTPPSTGGETTTSPPAASAGETSVVIQTSLGDITVALDREKAPATVENFLAYVAAGFYDGTIFHRVIPGFMIQGGGFTQGMEQKPTNAPVKNEAANNLKNVRGTIAMARTGEVDSATSQFFINVVDNAFLDHRDESAQGFGYAVFGRVTGGMDVVDKIAAVPTTTQAPFENVPQTPVVIESIRTDQP